MGMAATVLPSHQLVIKARRFLQTILPVGDPDPWLDHYPGYLSDLNLGPNRLRYPRANLYNFPIFKPQMFNQHHYLVSLFNTCTQNSFIQSICAAEKENKNAVALKNHAGQ